MTMIEDSAGDRNAVLLAAMRLASPALPVGAFAYSQGLEYAVEAGWIADAEGSRLWLEGLLENGLGRLDLPVLLRLHRAVDDPEAFAGWNHFILAARETAELRFEERQLGRALRQLLQSLEAPLPEATDCGWVAMFAWAARYWQLGEREACLAYAWSWLENQLAAAAKTVPIGQTDVQRLLQCLSPLLIDLCQRAEDLGDAEIGGGLPGLAMASILHETQYSRLFRS